MRVRVGHVDLEENTHVNQVFENAAALRVAWVTGTGRGDHDLEKFAEDHGYTVGNLEDEDAWLAVRSDFITEDLRNGKDAMHFTNAVVGRVHLTPERGEFETDAELEPRSQDNSRVLQLDTYRVSPLKS